jgi:hypothetical protein
MSRVAIAGNLMVLRVALIMTLSPESMTRWSALLGDAASRVAAEFPGELPERQPVHTVYGGAHLFSAGTASRLGQLALDSMRLWAPGPEDLAAIAGLDDDLAAKVHGLVLEKLAREPVEDFRIDFEDGYGHRSDEGRTATPARQQRSWHRE